MKGVLEAAAAGVTIGVGLTLAVLFGIWVKGLFD